MNITKSLLIAFALTSVTSAASADEERALTPQQNDRVLVSPDADNTRENIRDRQENAPTADDAGTAKDQRELAANIRRAVVKDSSLSTYAHNVKIVVEDGKVSLRGPVHSTTEREAVGRKATELAGKMPVDNQLEIVK